MSGHILRILSTKKIAIIDFGNFSAVEYKKLKEKTT